MFETNVKDFLATQARLEPTVDPSVPEGVALASIAISLKRLADDVSVIRVLLGPDTGIVKNYHRLDFGDQNAAGT